MKVGDLKAAFGELQRLYSAAGAKIPASDFEALEDALSGNEDLALDDFFARLEEEPPSSNQKKRALAHVIALEAAKLEAGPFEEALESLRKDKSITNSDLDIIGEQYTKSSAFGRLYKTKKAKIARLQEAFNEKRDFESRGRVIDELVPWQ